jgi:hypothetical protein
MCISCNPYKGFKGVSKKGMKTNTTPSQEIRDGYEAKSKKMNRRYKREMKRRRGRLGTRPEK